MKYSLNNGTNEKKSGFASVKPLIPYLKAERGIIFAAIGALVINSAINLSAPWIIARAIDDFIPSKDFRSIVWYAAGLLVLYVVGLLTSYAQTRLMGGVGQRILYKLRGQIFSKLQELPVSFFNQNKSGDLISRISNDTEKINAFFAQSLVQFMGSIFVMIGSAAIMITIHPEIGLATLIPAVGLYVITRMMSSWIKEKNADSMKALGSMSSEVQESIQNYKVIIASNRRDYFKNKFQSVNDEYYKTSLRSGFANNVFTPIFSFSAHIAQLILLVFGIYLISNGMFTVGLLISFISYLNSFYNPLRQIAALWANFQGALASTDRIQELLSLSNDLRVIPISETEQGNHKSRIEFKQVSFGYSEGAHVLQDVSLELLPGKTYALVGPTGGGKTTTASLMARLFDPTRGAIYLNGVDIRTYTEKERASHIGFILQEPVLFVGSVFDNVVYGNEYYNGATPEMLLNEIKQNGLDELLVRFDEGLDTKVGSLGEGLSLGQKQIIAFMRAVLRKPELLILDEATANIDTVTEQILEKILTTLPSSTTRVIIAHRLNTIENADEIFFVSGGAVIPAGSIEQATQLLLHNQKES